MDDKHSSIADILRPIFLNKDILFRIPTNVVDINWAEFFKRLDEVLNELKIKSYSISKSTLEDVFINFNKITKKIDKNKNSKLMNKIKKID